MSNKRNDGKKAEEFVRDVFVSLQEKKPFSFHRLYDTHSAGGSSIIPPQISDFLATYKGLSLAIEVKSSAKHMSLMGVPRSYIRATQIAKMRLHLRSGGIGLFIFVREDTKKFEIHSAEEVISWYRATNKRRKLGFPLSVGDGVTSLFNELIEELEK